MLNNALNKLITPIPTYIINIPARTERKENVIRQFEGRDEFDLQIIEGFRHSKGALGLWMSLIYILQNLIPPNIEYIIIGEDDIIFTEEYSLNRLLMSIELAKAHKADILLGGVSWFDNTIQVDDQLFWVNKFSGLHFTILFKKSFQLILNANLLDFQAADYKISTLTDNIFFAYPFLAIQYEFGYSDATISNDQPGVVNKLFEVVNARLKMISGINKIFKNTSRKNSRFFSQLASPIPTYVINLPERIDRLAHIQSEFENKPEFELTIVKAIKDNVGALGLWMTIRQIIKLAIEKEQKMIIICEDDHMFTANYNREFLFKNIYDASEDGTLYMSGGTSKCYNAVPITANRFWIRHCLATQFTVIFQDFYQHILDEPFNNQITADIAYSRMAFNKMIIYPFISIQKDFGYSDVTYIHNKNFVSNMFHESDLFLKMIQEKFIKYNLH